GARAHAAPRRPGQRVARRARRRGRAADGAARGAHRRRVPRHVRRGALRGPAARAAQRAAHAPRRLLRRRGAGEDGDRGRPEHARGARGVLEVKALVLGGSGFVGSHVADALADAGCETTIFDRLPSPWLRADQRFVEGDLTALDDVVAAVAGQEVVYNFAGIADIDAAGERPVDTVAVNVLGNAHVLEASVRAGVRRYLFASSIYVASEAGSFYRVSKQACELYIEEYGRRHGLPYTILRYGTLYGRRASDENSVHRYLRQALRDRRIVASGTGEELREYIHVEDAARLSVEVLDER